MEWTRLVLFCLSISNSLWSASCCCDDLNFPLWFKFGVSSSAYQIEGAWNVSDKSECIWDRFTHTPGNIADGSNGDIACDSYHLWRRDVDMLTELGVQMYRFSISWARLLPKGFANYVSEDGKKYYSDLIDALVERGIEPVVTLYHWEMPQKLQDFGGWTNPLIADWFADYARVVFTLYGDRVKTFITINEGTIICDVGYMNSTFHAPGIVDKEVAPFLCNKHILLAHAKAWRIYDEEFKKKCRGKVSLSNNLMWFEPYSNTTEDAMYSDVLTEFVNGRYLHPIFSQQGGWPPIVEKYLKHYSWEVGYLNSVLPAFTQEEVYLIRGTYDFLAINYYTSRVVRRARSKEQRSPFLWGAPIDAVLDVKPNWKYGFDDFFVINPEGIRHILFSLKQKYGDVDMMITENGYSDAGQQLKDDERATFIKEHLEQILLSIKQDDVNVIGYTYWTIMDNFEWAGGYNSKFGLYQVNFTDPHRTRTPRKSAFYFANIARSHSLSTPLYSG